MLQLERTRTMRTARTALVDDSQFEGFSSFASAQQSPPPLDQGTIAMIPAVPVAPPVSSPAPTSTLPTVPDSEKPAKSATSSTSESAKTLPPTTSTEPTAPRETVAQRLERQRQRKLQMRREELRAQQARLANPPPAPDNAYFSRFHKKLQKPPPSNNPQLERLGHFGPAKSAETQSSAADKRSSTGSLDSSSTTTKQKRRGSIEVGLGKLRSATQALTTSRRASLTSSTEEASPVQEGFIGGLKLRQAQEAETKDKLKLQASDLKKDADHPLRRRATVVSSPHAQQQPTSILKKVSFSDDKPKQNVQFGKDKQQDKQREDAVKPSQHDSATDEALRTGRINPYNGTIPQAPQSETVGLQADPKESRQTPPAPSSVPAPQKQPTSGLSRSSMTIRRSYGPRASPPDPIPSYVERARLSSSPSLSEMREANLLEAVHAGSRNTTMSSHLREPVEQQPSSLTLETSRDQNAVHSSTGFTILHEDFGNTNMPADASNTGPKVHRLEHVRSWQDGEIERLDIRNEGFGDNLRASFASQPPTPSAQVPAESDVVWFDAQQDKAEVSKTPLAPSPGPETGKQPTPDTRPSISQSSTPRHSSPEPSRSQSREPQTETRSGSRTSMQSTNDTQGLRTSSIPRTSAATASEIAESLLGRPARSSVQVTQQTPTQSLPAPAPPDIDLSFLPPLKHQPLGSPGTKQRSPSPASTISRPGSFTSLTDVHPPLIKNAKTSISDSTVPLKPAARNSPSPGSSSGGSGSSTPTVKVFVICCSCQSFHDMPSKVYACMTEPDTVVTDAKLGVSATIGKTVKCPWCGHGMSTGCCTGHVGIVQLKERLH